MSAASSPEPRAASTSMPPRSPSHRAGPPTPSRASWTASPGSPAPLTTATDAARARQAAARLIGARPEQIALSPATTLALNVAADAVPLHRGRTW